MTRRSAGSLLLPILALLLPLALGQTPPQDLFAAVVASDINAITYDCADEYGPGFDEMSCMEASGQLSTIRSRLDRALAAYTDVEALLPWDRLEGDGVSRMYAVHQDDGTLTLFQIGMFPYPNSPRVTALAVLYLGHFDSEGNPIE